VITSVGFGEIHPYNIEERMSAVLLMIIGSVVFGVSI